MYYTIMVILIRFPQSFCIFNDFMTSDFIHNLGRHIQLPNYDFVFFCCSFQSCQFWFMCFENITVFWYIHMHDCHLFSVNQTLYNFVLLMFTSVGCLCSVVPFTKAYYSSTSFLFIHVCKPTYFYYFIINSSRIVCKQMFFKNSI